MLSGVLAADGWDPLLGRPLVKKSWLKKAITWQDGYGHSASLKLSLTLRLP